MKKLLLSLLLVTTFLLVGCNKVTTKVPTTASKTTNTITSSKSLTKQTLETPKNLMISSEGILTFEAVAGAKKYRISVTSADSTRQYFVENNYDLTLFLDYGEYKIKIQAVSDDITSEFSNEVTFKYEEEKMKELSELLLTDPNYIRWNGRNFYDESSKKNYFYYTASGFEVDFFGTELTANIYSTATSALKTCAYIVVLVDGEVYPEAGKTIALNNADGNYTLASGLTEGYHHVEVLKRTEAIDNTTALVSLTTDNKFVTPIENKKTHNILVIGASGSAGYGNLATDTNVVKTPQNSDGLKAFGYLTARMFDANVEMVNASGWGVKYGWNTTDGKINIPYAFERVGMLVNGSVVNEPQAYLSYTPDVIILNLGMNDFNAFINSAAQSANKAKLTEEYKVAFEAFLKKLHNIYPNAIIVEVHTQSSSETPYNIEISEKVNTEIGTFVYSLTIPTNGSNGDGLGANNHANVKTHIRTSDIIAEKIMEVKNWTKVRNNIVFDENRDVFKEGSNGENEGGETNPDGSFNVNANWDTDRPSSFTFVNELEGTKISVIGLSSGYGMWCRANFKLDNGDYKKLVLKVKGDVGLGLVIKVDANGNPFDSVKVNKTEIILDGTIQELVIEFANIGTGLTTEQVKSLIKMVIMPASATLTEGSFTVLSAVLNK